MGLVWLSYTQNLEEYIYSSVNCKWYVFLSCGILPVLWPPIITDVRMSEDFLEVKGIMYCLHWSLKDWLNMSESNMCI